MESNEDGYKIVDRSMMSGRRNAMSRLRLIIFFLSLVVLLGTTSSGVTEPPAPLPAPTLRVEPTRLNPSQAQDKAIPPAMGCDAFADLLAQAGHPNAAMIAL